MQMHELWLAVASSGERPWWSVFLNAEDVNYEIFLELVAKAHGAHLQAPLNQMIEDIQEQVPSWLYDLSRSWYGFISWTFREIPDVFSLTIRLSNF